MGCCLLESGRLWLSDKIQLNPGGTWALSSPSLPQQELLGSYYPTLEGLQFIKKIMSPEL